MRYQTFRWMVVAGLCVILLQGLISRAQEKTLTLTLTTEHEIGFECPIASTQQPGTDTMWVLVDNCRGLQFSLHAYDLKSGEALDTVPILLDEIDGNVYAIYNLMPLAFTSNGTLELFAANNETDDIARFQIDPESGATTSDASADEQLNNFLRQFSDYPSFSVTFSPDHTRAISFDNDGLALYVLDLVAEDVLFKLEGAFSLSGFSPDSQQLYVGTLDDPDNFEADGSTVSIYNLPDDTVIQSLPLPISLVYPSPDGRYVAFQTAPNEGGTEQLGLVELATGAVSPLLKISIEPHKVLTCVNSGRNVSDVDLTTSGQMSLRALEWLPDSSGFVTANSYGNQVSGSSSNPCFWENSRLRYYQIADKP
jgi:hypothetical protein